MAQQLDQREAEVLRTVIRMHVASGEPVGSQTVSRAADLSLSAASIRNIMARLEEEGLLTQPHTSAGRVPTDLAYRTYVDSIMPRPALAPAHAEAIDRALSAGGEGISEVLGQASRQLSLFSNQVGLVLVPPLQQVLVENIEFLRLDGGRAVAVVVGRSGVVHSRVLVVEPTLGQAELSRIGQFLSEHFSGMTLSQIREELGRRLAEERAQYDEMVMKSLQIGEQALAVEDDEADLIIEGASNLLSSPEFADLDLTRALFKTLEDKETLIRLLTQLLEGGGVRVMIGQENPLSDLARCSLVASHYGADGRVMGSVGIVGPTRMEYAKAIALVEHLAHALSRILSVPEN